MCVLGGCFVSFCFSYVSLEAYIRLSQQWLALMGKAWGQENRNGRETYFLLYTLLCSLIPIYIYNYFKEHSYE